MGRSRGAQREPLSDLSPVHLLQNTKSPEALEEAAAFLCCLDLHLFSIQSDDVMLLQWEH